MAIRQTICGSLGGFLCAKSEISPQTQENISNWRSVAECRRISRDLIGGGGGGGDHVCFCPFLSARFCPFS